MQEVPCDTNRNGPYKNDLNQGKSQVGFSGAEEPHVENAKSDGGDPLMRDSSGH